jgi:hypothetical protein
MRRTPSRKSRLRLMCIPREGVGTFYFNSGWGILADLPPSRNMLLTTQPLIEVGSDPVGNLLCSSCPALCRASTSFFAMN